MAKLYTRTGDRGTTGLADGSRVPKDHPRVRAYGAVDELNALLGLCRAASGGDELRSKLGQIQEELFVLGGDLAAPHAAKKNDIPRVTAAQTQRLEEWIDDATEDVPPLRSFVLPGGCELACRFHHARTVCRAAERQAVTLANAETINDQAVVYLNRLGDLLFAWARQANHEAGHPETTWPAPKD
ncbi:MAG: cob(I)yrinic acid a,c-diamide adenosyltransferase [Phycisphaerales bacterium]|nr:MAG: cob(I)yrinic acid a,c-diamide adenosyltransferase [Phycisphaerales bacterium]